MWVNKGYIDSLFHLVVQIGITKKHSPCLNKTVLAPNKLPFFLLTAPRLASTNTATTSPSGASRKQTAATRGQTSVSCRSAQCFEGQMRHLKTLCFSFQSLQMLFCCHPVFFFSVSVFDLTVFCCGYNEGGRLQGMPAALCCIPTAVVRELCPSASVLC